MAFTRILSHLPAFVAVAGLLVGGVFGCSQQPEAVEVRKPPRPVSTMTLTTTRPGVASEVTGSVVSWKTEQIGFEVPGRVSQVIEPNEQIEGRIVAQNGETHLLSEGTPLARLDDERLRIAVESAKAAVEVSRRQIDAVQVDIEQRIPASIAAVEAEKKLAEIELARTQKLFDKSASTQANLDQATTNMATAEANLARSKAELAARHAELRSLEAQTLQAEQQLADAERNLKDAVLYSSFRGQVAKTHVLPGSYVAAGDPVVTVQLMDPVSVEFELSAAASRKFQHGDSLRVYTINPAQQRKDLCGFVYLTDAVADPQTRTFTVKLLARNEEVQMAPPTELQGHPVARTVDLWPMNIGPILSGDKRLFVEEESIHHDAQGAFVWKATNRHMGEISDNKNRVLTVEKIRVAAQPVSVPFLGNWHFVPVTIQSDQNFDPERDLIAGKLIVEGQKPDDWNGDKLLYDRGGWLLRPGDLVRVELSDESNEAGLYVPMKAIRHAGDQAAVFVVDRSNPDRLIARKVLVTIATADETLRSDAALQRIEPEEPGALASGAELVVEGTHYLVDGDEIVVIKKPGAAE
ncbi:efflux RND transporter periplasmic adaptor subunit [Blastopirellula sp. JC732]|uniref:Efflux RND transporter periplasmic adaptor subunit n=1 Tax=Blastopirellula sediminis TaxID=2894196 RepID=A0A9X1MQE8_9BACT|nr:HlyD family secretion protein [Blastopirellula sediminis]MCC9606247.1 efflux RND transporter periplasmic adaptor subunit [Blastopirellula sediminis]MCC9630455.1 efflux RND transporter periplasmic adaptor subunit [Blastopirellula sediminis]